MNVCTLKNEIKVNTFAKKCILFDMMVLEKNHFVITPSNDRCLLSIKYDVTFHRSKNKKRILFKKIAVLHGKFF